MNTLLLEPPLPFKFYRIPTKSIVLQTVIIRKCHNVMKIHPIVYCILTQFHKEYNVLIIPFSVILNIKAATDHSCLENCSGAKYKIFTVTFLIFINNNIPFRWLSTASSTGHQSFLLLVCLYSCFIDHLFIISSFHHGCYNFFLTGFINFLVQTWYQPCAPECTKFLAFPCVWFVLTQFSPKNTMSQPDGAIDQSCLKS